MQGKTAELEQIVRQKDLEVERLQQQLERRKSSGSSDSSVDVCAAVELDEDPSDAYANEVGVAADMHTRSIYTCVSAFDHKNKCGCIGAEHSAASGCTNGVQLDAIDRSCMQSIKSNIYSFVSTNAHMRPTKQDISPYL